MNSLFVYIGINILGNIRNKPRHGEGCGVFVSVFKSVSLLGLCHGCRVCMHTIMAASLIGLRQVQV